jgi:hypothetical protein
VTPAVSVVVPTFQRRELVVGAVRSVLAQTFEDFELIVVDDGSTDGTGEALAGIDQRVRYTWQENRGVSAARNAALRLAAGEIVAFLDSDNRWLPGHLAVVTAVLARHPEAVLVTTCPGARLGGAAPVDGAEVVDLLPRLIFGSPVGYTSCVAARRAAVVAAGGFDEHMEVLEDSDLWLRVSMLGPVCMVARRTIEHRVTAGGLKRRGIASGAYLEAFARSAAAAAGALAEIERPDAAELRTRARAKVALVDAVRAVRRGELDAAGSALADACRLMPSLSDDPSRVVVVLNHATDDPVELLAATMTTARIWPAQRSDTARYLWSYALVRALRARRLREAATCLRTVLRSPNLSFVVRERQLTAELTRLWLHERRRRPELRPDEA